MFCVNCGAKLDEGDKFCTNCGMATNEILESNNDISLLEKIKTIADYDNYTTVDHIKTFKFGKYPQNDISGKAKEPIDWIVIYRDENKALLLSKYILDCKCYNNNEKDAFAFWEECDLRKWLNNEFLKIAFTENELNQILLTKHSDIEDKIFCIEPNDIRKYVYDYEYGKEGYEIRKLATTGTKYAENVNNNGGKLRKITTSLWYIDNYSFWLGKNGSYVDSAYFCSSAGIIDEDGRDCIDRDVGVRPAMWIKYDKSDNNNKEIIYIEDQEFVLDDNSNAEIDFGEPDNN